MSSIALGSLELTVLLAVSRLGDEAYGLAIREDISTRLKRDYSVGAVYTTLQRLEGKRLLASRTTEPVTLRGGRSRREFRLTAAGRRALHEAQRTATAAWSGVALPIRPEPA